MPRSLCLDRLSHKSLRSSGISRVVNW